MDRIAFFSPLNPIRSGISDYSEDLLPHLKKHLNIDIFVPDNFEVQNQDINKQFRIRYFKEFANLYKEKYYSSIVYHMGNSYNAHKDIYEFILKYPGIVVLHDYSLHHFYAAKTLEYGNMKAYEDEMFYSHGFEGLNEVEKFKSGKIAPIWENNSLEFPLNLRVLDKAAGVIVHSNFAKQQLLKIVSYVPIFVLPLPALHIINKSELETVKMNSRRDLHIESDLVLSTLGFINQTKRVDKILLALAELKREGTLSNFHFYIVGEVSPSYKLEDEIKKLNLTKNVTVTGYVNMENFEKYIAASDICFNLRYPTQGENSASLLRILGYGKPVIVTDIGSFSEFPEGIVFKTAFDKNEIPDIKKHIKHILKNSSEKIAENILDFTQKNYNINICAEMYRDFIQLIQNGKECNLLLAINDSIVRFTNVIADTFNCNVENLEEQYAIAITQCFYANRLAE